MSCASPTIISTSTFSVSIEGWGSSGDVAVEGNKIFFQAFCFPSSLCNFRVEQLEEGLKRSRYCEVVERRSFDDLLFFVLPLPSSVSKCNPTEIVKHLSLAFDRGVHLIPNNYRISLPIRSVWPSPYEMKWDEQHKSSALSVDEEGTSLEWKSNHELSWVSALTTARLSCGLQQSSTSFNVEFRIDNNANTHIGIGFVLDPPDFGDFGYLGASKTSWSFDSWEGAIINGTEYIHERLPLVKNGGYVTLRLDLRRGEGSKATFLVGGISTPAIPLPQNAVVIPAACFLNKSQKITLTNLIGQN